MFSYLMNRDPQKVAEAAVRTAKEQKAAADKKLADALAAAEKLEQKEEETSKLKKQLDEVDTFFLEAVRNNSREKLLNASQVKTYAAPEYEEHHALYPNFKSLTNRQMLLNLELAGLTVSRTSPTSGKNRYQAYNDLGQELEKVDSIIHSVKETAAKSSELIDFDKHYLHMIKVQDDLKAQLQSRTEAKSGATTQKATITSKSSVSEITQFDYEIKKLEKDRAEIFADYTNFSDLMIALTQTREAYGPKTRAIQTQLEAVKSKVCYTKGWAAKYDDITNQDIKETLYKDASEKAKTIEARLAELQIKKVEIKNQHNLGYVPPTVTAAPAPKR